MRIALEDRNEYVSQINQLASRHPTEVKAEQLHQKIEQILHYAMHEANHDDKFCLALVKLAQHVSFTLKHPGEYRTFLPSE